VSLSVQPLEDYIERVPPEDQERVTYTWEAAAAGDGIVVSNPTRKYVIIRGKETSEA
jgi:hypothetical protein